MVNPGKPSRGCAMCKGRKIKCDMTEPSCLRCIKSGWTCPGYPAVLFRDQTATVVRKIQKSFIDSQQGGSQRTRHVSPSLPDRAVVFFLSKYVVAGIYEYLPELLRQDKGEGSLGTIVRAAGIVALANAGASPEWRTEGYSLYGKALCKLQSALQHPVEAKSDLTLAAIMLMGIFESIAYADDESMKSFGNHTIAAARCIELRGPTQFRSEASAKLFMQIRRVIITTCHQLQVPMPYAFEKWSSWAESIQPKEAIVSNQFAAINEHLAAVRAEIKRKGITNPLVVSSQLLQVDAMFERWRQHLPQSWEFRSYRSLGSTSESIYNGQCDMYSNLWLASMWNNYRCVRLLIHESIATATLKFGPIEDKASLKSSVKTLIAMADGVCHSVPYHLGFRYGNSPKKRVRDGENSAPGGYLLLWPLFLSGMLRTTPPTQRAWIASTMRRIGSQMGLQLAMSMATSLEEKMLSFSDGTTWFIGEFHPS